MKTRGAYLDKLNSLWHSAEAKILLGVFLFIALFVSVAVGILPAQYELEEGQISPDTIYAARSVIDQEATSLARAAAAEQVEDVYLFDSAVEGRVIDKVTGPLAYLMALPGAPAEELTPEQAEEALQGTVAEFLTLFPEVGNEDNALLLLSIPQESVEQALVLTKSLIHATLSPGIKPDGAAAALQKIKTDLYQAQLSTQLRDLVIVNLENNFRHNRIYSPEETAAQRRRARDQVENIIILKGAKVIDRGETVTRAHLSQLRALGMLETSFAYGYYLGLLVLVASIFGAWGYYLHRYRPELFSSPSRLVLIGLIVILTIWAAKLFGGLLFGAGSPYLIPAAMASLLLAIIFDVHLALFFGTTLALVLAFTAGSELNVLVMALIGSVVGAYSVSKVNQRSDLTRAGLLVAAANVAGILGLTLIGNGLALTPTSVQGTLLDLALGVGGGLLSSVFAVGLLPVIESAFGITTPIRLLELANPNQKPLKRLLLEAPGTYNHSIMVGNLAEAAAETVGADPVLCRVGAYYHDLGKLSRPYFFIENQFQGNNPHDRIPPSLSSMILVAHVRNGVELAREYKLPPVIKDIIEQHHGTTLISFFYHRAQSERGSRDQLLEDKFRYEGPKPQFKESGIIMLADSVEAAVRSISQPSQFRIEGMVEKIVQEKLADGQLDQCDLTLKDLSQISRAFVQVFTGIYHKRIAYPSEKDLAKISS